MRIRWLFSLFLAAGLTADARPNALAEEQMSWTVNSYPSDIPGNADTVILTYGIPETAAVRTGPRRALFFGTTRSTLRRTRM